MGSIAGIRLSPRHVGGAVLLAMALLRSLNDNGIEPFISNGKANGVLTGLIWLGVKSWDGSSRERQ